MHHVNQSFILTAVGFYFMNEDCYGTNKELMQRALCFEDRFLSLRIWACFVFILIFSSNTVASNSDAYISDIYTLNSRTIVLETYKALPAESEYQTANKSVENYQLLCPTNITILSVKAKSGEKKITLSLSGDTMLGEDATVSYSGIYLKSSSGGNYLPNSGELSFRVCYTPERPELIGTPLTWGDSNNGRLNTNGLENIVAVTAGLDYTLYLKNDGTVINKGSSICESVSNWTNVVAISAHESVAAGLKADGTVLLAGAISSLGTSWREWTNMVQVAVNNDVLLGLGSDRKLKIAGNLSTYNANNLVFGNIVAIGLGDGSTPYLAALDTDETLHWFSPANPAGATVANVEKFAVGYQHLIYIKKDGTIVVEDASGSTWGLGNTTGLEGSLIEAVAAGNSHNLYLMAGEVKIKGMSDQSWTTLPTELLGTHAPIMAVAAGRKHSVALLKAEGQDEENAISETFSINEGEVFEYQITIPEFEGKGVVYSFSPEPLPESMVFNEENGAFYWQTDEADGPGNYQVTLRASDAEDDLNFVDIDLSVEVKEINQPPILQVSDTAITVTAGVSLDLLVLAEDLDLPKNTLTFSLVDPPSGMSIDPVTGRITWDATIQDLGDHTVEVVVCDDFVPATCVSESFCVTVIGANIPLSVIEIPNNTIPELTLWSCSLEAVGGEGAYQWDLVDWPDGMTLVGSVLSWRPSEAQGNGASYPVTVQVTDANSDVAEMSFILAVSEVKTAPIIEPISENVLRVGDTLNVTVLASDPDLPADTLAYSIVAGAPQGMLINPANGNITFLLSKELYRADPYVITVKVEDGSGLSSQAQFTLRTEYVNEAPTIAGDSTEVTIPELSLANITALLGWGFHDEDNEKLSFALGEGAPEGMSVDSAGNIFWIPSEEQGPGVYAAFLVVSDLDEVSPSDTRREFVVTVTEVNSEPYFSCSLEKLAIVGETLSLSTVKATDSDIPAQKISYTLQGGAPSGLRLYSNGDIIWTPSKDQVGEHLLTILATDNGNPVKSGSATLKITVNESASSPLYFIPVENLHVKEHSLFQVVLMASANGGADPISYSLLKSHTGMQLDSVSGCFSWIPAESDGGKSFEVIVNGEERTGKKRSAQISFVITVDEVNNAPVISPIPLIRINEDVVLSYPVVAVDPEADDLTYSVISLLPDDYIQEDDIYFSDNIFYWHIREPHGPGGYTATVRVTDSGGLFAETSFRVLVRAVNTAPRFTFSETTFDVYQGQDFTTVITAADDDIPKEQLVISKTSGPVGLTIHPYTGAVHWRVPLNHQVGTTSFGIQVTDVNAGGATRLLTLNVHPWTNVEATSGVIELSASLHEGEPFEFCLDTDSTSGWKWSLNSAPKDMVFDSENSTLRWTPGELDGGQSREVWLQADVGGARRSQTLCLTLDIAEVNSAPQIEELAIPAFRLNQEVRFFVKMSDSDIPFQHLNLSLISALPPEASFNPLTGEFCWRPRTKSQFVNGGRNLKFKVNDSGVPSLSSEKEIRLYLLEDEGGEPSVQYEYIPSSTSAEVVKLNWNIQEGKEYSVYVSNSNPCDEWLLIGKVLLTQDALIFESSYALKKTGWFYVEDDGAYKWPLRSYEKTKEGLLRMVWERNISSLVAVIKTSQDGSFSRWEPLLQLDLSNHNASLQQKLGSGSNEIRNVRIVPKN